MNRQVVEEIQLANTKQTEAESRKKLWKCKL